MGRLILALILGVVLGAGGARAFREAPARELAPSLDLPVAQVASPPQSPDVLAVPAAPERVVANSTRETIASESDVLIPAALQRYAELGIQEGWKSVRADVPPAADLAEGMQDFEKLVMESPARIGRSLGERRTKAEEALADAKSGGVLTLLECLGAGVVGPLPDLVRDPDQFEPLFQRTAAEELRFGLLDRDRPDNSVEDGVTLTWPAGVYRLNNVMRNKDPYPRDVTFAGAGMDATMLLLTHDFSTRGSLRNFVIRDCTVHTNNHYLFDLRLKPAALRFERVRFVGFDMGAGASCLFGTKELAMSAKFCRFEGGYGSSPQHGTIFDVRTSGLIARFDSCSISLVSLDVRRLQPGATVLFRNCVLDEILDDPVTDAANRGGIMFEGCTVRRHAGGSETVPSLDLNVLFPNWRDRIE